MQTYELMYVLGGDLTEAEFAPHRARVEKHLTDSGATISRNESAGKIKLAYPIGAHRFGNYFLVWFQAEPAIMKKISNLLRLDTDLLRQVVVRADEVNPLTATFALQVKEEPPRSREERPAAPIQERPAVAAPEMSMEDIEKKIDEMLTEEVK